MSPLRRLALVAAALLVAGCQSTPTAPPALDLPPATLARVPVDLDRWWVAFDDPALTRLVDEALASNLDIAAAIARVELARSNVLLAQSYLYPSANLQAGTVRSRISTLGSPPLPSEVDPLSNNYRLGVQASYELDVWGKYRTSTQAARQTLLASEYGRETVRTAVAAEVARAYFSLLAAEAELALLRDTLKSRDESVALQRDRYEAGIVGELDLRQAEAERAALLANVATAERAVGLLESALATLAGRTPREVYAPAVERTSGAQRLLAVPTIPEGLPSGLLERRPDVRRVEAELAAASLRVDVARADYFPSISLTGFFGSESAALGTLFTGPGAAWNLGASLLQPLIGLKAIEANVEAQSALRAQAIVTYRQTVQNAFRETHDALVVNRTSRAALAAQSQRRGELERALELADLRYRAGYSSYLEVLDAQRQLLQAQTLELVAARDARNALVDLARALGGGWSPDTVAAAPR
jgi:multidrug efflux system outer membrane protein